MTAPQLLEPAEADAPQRSRWRRLLGRVGASFPGRVRAAAFFALGVVAATLILESRIEARLRAAHHARWLASVQVPAEQRAWLAETTGDGRAFAARVAAIDGWRELAACDLAPMGYGELLLGNARLATIAATGLPGAGQACRERLAAVAAAACERRRDGFAAVRRGRAAATLAAECELIGATLRDLAAPQIAAGLVRAEAVQRRLATVEHTAAQLGRLERGEPLAAPAAPPAPDELATLPAAPFVRWLDELLGTALALRLDAAAADLPAERFLAETRTLLAALDALAVRDAVAARLGDGALRPPVAAALAKLR